MGLPPAFAVNIWVRKCLRWVRAVMGWMTSLNLILHGQWRHLFHTYPCPPARSTALLLCDMLEYHDCIGSIYPLIKGLGTIVHHRGGETEVRELAQLVEWWRNLAWKLCSLVFNCVLLPWIHSCYRNLGPEEWLTLLMEMQNILFKTLAPPTSSPPPGLLASHTWGDLQQSQSVPFGLQVAYHQRKVRQITKVLPSGYFLQPCQVVLTSILISLMIIAVLTVWKGESSYQPT